VVENSKKFAHELPGLANKGKDMLVTGWGSAVSWWKGDNK